MATHPYNVFCDLGLHNGGSCGKKSLPLTKDEYTKQMWDANSRWKCPICGGLAHWDEDSYDRFYEELEQDEQVGHIARGF